MVGFLTGNGRKGCGPSDVPQHGLQLLPGQDRVTAGGCNLLCVGGTGIDLRELFQRLGLGGSRVKARDRGGPSTEATHRSLGRITNYHWVTHFLLPLSSPPKFFSKKKNVFENT